MILTLSCWGLGYCWDLLKQFYINFVLIAGHKFYDITRIIFSREPFVSPGNLQTDPLTRNLLDILSSPLSESFRSQSNGRKWCLKWLCVNMKIAWCVCNGWDGCFCSPLSFNFLLPSDPVGTFSSAGLNHKQQINSTQAFLRKFLVIKSIKKNVSLGKNVQGYSVLLLL